MIILNRILSLTIVLGIIVLVHELGHYIAARLVGVRVETFSFGFGKRLFGKKIGDTDVRVSLIPLGGYVKMAGEEDYENRDPKPDEFVGKNRAQKILILFMGPFMNFLLAFIILTIINISGVEIEKYRSEAPVIGYVRAESPAEEAGIQKGDLILSVAGKTIKDWQDLDLTIGSNPNEDLPVVYQRNGEKKETSMRVGVLAQDNMNPAGLYWGFQTVIQSLDSGKPAEKAGMKSGDIVLAINGTDVTFFDIKDIIASSEDKPLLFKLQRGEEIVELSVVPEKVGEELKIGVGMLAYAPSFKTNLGFISGVKRGASEMVRMTSLTIMAFKKLFTGKINPKHLSGPIDIAKVSQQAMESGPSSFFILIAFLSLHIGLINLFPIPVLDGGHLMIYSIESIIRRDFSPRVKVALMNLGLFFIVILMAFAILNDIAKNLPNGWSSFLPF